MITYTNLWTRSFLVDLSPKERRPLPKMGDSSRSFDVEEIRKDVDLLSALSPVRASRAQLGGLVEDSYMAYGSEAYTSALLVYQYARTAGKGAALDGALDALGQRCAQNAQRQHRQDDPTPPLKCQLSAPVRGLSTSEPSGRTSLARSPSPRAESRGSEAQS